MLGVEVIVQLHLVWAKEGHFLEGLVEVDERLLGIYVGPVQLRRGGSSANTDSAVGAGSVVVRLQLDMDST